MGMMIRTTRIAAGVRMGRVFSELTSPKKPVKVNPEEAKLASLTQKERQIIRAVVEGSGAPNKTLASQPPYRAHVPQSPHGDQPEAWCVEPA
jgi:hypothetical protein